MVSPIRNHKYLANPGDVVHMNSACIYLIEIGSRYYVGSTMALGRRISCHINHLKAQKSTNPILQAAYNKHGDPRFHVVEIVKKPTRDKLHHIEQHYIDMLIHDDQCMNIAAVAQKGNPERRRVIYDGVLYESVTDLANHLGVKCTNVVSWLSGRNPIPSRFSTDLRYEIGDSGLVHSNPQIKPVSVDDVVYESQSEAALAVGVSISQVSDWICGRSPIPLRYGIKSIHFVGHPDKSRINPAIRRVVVNGVEFPSCTIAAKSVGVSKVQFGQWLNGKQIPAKYNIHELRYAQ